MGSRWVEGSGHYLASEGFADQLPLLVADAVWEFLRDKATRVADEVTAALEACLEQPVVSRAAALLFQVATFDAPELQPLRLALVRAARPTWHADPDMRERVQILRRWAEGEETADQVAVELLTVAAELSAMVATDSDEDLVWQVRVLEDLVGALDLVRERTAEQVAYGVVNSRRVVTILTELAGRDEPTYLRWLAAAHFTAAQFLASANSPEPAIAESEHGIQLSQKHFRRTPEIGSALALDKAWATHRGLLRRLGDSAQASAAHSEHRAVLHACVAALTKSASAQGLRQWLDVLRRRECFDDAVTVSARVVELAAEAAVAEDIPAWGTLATALRAHGETQYRAGRHDDAALSWQRFIEVRQRIVDLGAAADGVAEAFQQLVRLADQLENPAMAVAFGRYATVERAECADRDPDVHLAILVEELRAHAYRLHSVGLASEAAEVAERGLTHARVLVEKDPVEHRAELSGMLTCAAAMHREAGQLTAADRRSAEALAVAEQLAQADPDSLSHAANALHNRALVLGGLGNRTAAKELLTRSAALYRSIAADNTEMQGSLSNVLCTAAANQIDLSEYEEALACVQEAEATFARLAGADPNRYLGDHAYALTTQAVLHHRIGEYELAQHAAAAALEFCGRLKPGHSRDERRFDALRTLAEISADSGNDRAALEYARSLLELGERMVDEGRSEQADLIDALSVLTRCLSRVGETLEALETSTRTVALLYELSESERDPRKCADVLDRYASALTETGRHDEALEMSAQALTYAEQLLASNRDTHLVTVGKVLNNHAFRLDNSGRPEEAIIFTARAIDINEELSLLDERHRSEVGINLLNYANQLINLERYEEALEAAVRTVAVFDEPNPCETSELLAKALANHATALSRLDRHHEAVRVQERAVRIVQDCAAEEHLAFLPQLARTTRALAAWMSAADQWPEAKHRSAAAVRLWWEAAQHDRRHLSDLVDVVDRHAEYCHDRRDSAGAATDLGEIIGWARQFGSTADAKDRLLVVNLLGTYAWMLGDSGQRQAALDTAQAAVTLVEEVIEGSDDDHRAKLADTLDSLADALADCGRYREALRYNARALELWRQMAGKGRAHRSNLAWSLWHHAAWHAEAEAESAVPLHYSMEALRIYRELCRADPEEVEYLAGALVDHARHLARVGRHTEAVEISAQALEMIESNAIPDPDTHGADLATCLRHHASHLVAIGRADDALENARRALRFIEPAAAKIPLRYLPELAAICEDTARLVVDRDPATADALNERALRIYTQLAPAEPELFRPRLRDGG
ncbi:tetratricopeptide repeat protein [Nocardia sp. NPDC051787]|uniref:tetratricopeptide repeat protein n=1 Tax=Nocardia sp. NPDC051787 TaxID=3155415 RepID=UPI00341AD4C2